jgi:hypothetical protein
MCSGSACLRIMEQTQFFWGLPRARLHPRCAGPRADRYRIVRSQPGHPSGAKPRGPSTAGNLGDLSAQYETGGRGVSTVSSGMGRNGIPDRGGVSYGSYQMTSQTPQRDKNGNLLIVRNGGNVARFLQTDGARWANEFAGHQPGSSSFSAAWRRIAQREGAALHTAEHTWVKRENYDPAARLIKNETRLDVDVGPPALRDVLWSTAVQHGAGSPKRPRLDARRIFIDAVNRTDTTLARTDLGYYEALIRNVYARRTAFWPSDRPRYESELRAALRRLKAP